MKSKFEEKYIKQNQLKTQIDLLQAEQIKMKRSEEIFQKLSRKNEILQESLKVTISKLENVILFFNDQMRSNYEKARRRLELFERESKISNVPEEEKERAVNFSNKRIKRK